MPGPSKVIVLDPDPRAARQLEVGFSREGIAVAVLDVPAQVDQLALPDPPSLVLIGGDARSPTVALVQRVRELLAAGPTDVPIVVTARGAQRAELESAGADEVITRPVYLRDVVTVARVLRGIPAEQRGRVVGSLAETTGVYTLVRALSRLGRSAVLTLIRGLRRGEVRFFRGEVTSAQVGLIHGQAALHQLLLWTDARFELVYQDVVRRQQIPLTPDELFVDAERFLEDVRESAGQLSPSMVLEPDPQRVQNLGTQIPTEVHGILRMFDGHRVLADILEDSPYRVFETLRVAQKAVEVGLLRAVESQRPKATWKAVLAIDEWLVGSDKREVNVDRTQTPGADPAAVAPWSRRRDQALRRQAREQPAAAGGSGIDWGALVPRPIGSDVGPLSPVVPAQAAYGEVEAPPRPPREVVDPLIDTDKRGLVNPTDIGLEPSVVVDAATTTPFVRVEPEAGAATTPFTRVELDAATTPFERPTPPPQDTPIPAASDDPSDGVIRAAIASPDSSRGPRVPPPGGPEHDGPPIKETTGEIGIRAPRDAPELSMSEPSILVDAEDAMLVSDDEPTAAAPADDRGEDPRPPTFWDRMFGRPKPK